MSVKLSRVINGELCFWGSYNLSNMAEAQAFTNAVWKFGENGDAVVIEKSEEQEETAYLREFNEGEKLSKEDIDWLTK